jgi:hypothetical protein
LVFFFFPFVDEDWLAASTAVAVAVAEAVALSSQQGAPASVASVTSAAFTSSAISMFEMT